MPPLKAFLLAIALVICIEYAIYALERPRLADVILVILDYLYSRPLRQMHGYPTDAIWMSRITGATEVVVTALKHHPKKRITHVRELVIADVGMVLVRSLLTLMNCINCFSLGQDNGVILAYMYLATRSAAVKSVELYDVDFEPASDSAYRLQFAHLPPSTSRLFTGRMRTLAWPADPMAAFARRTFREIVDDA